MPVIDTIASDYVGDVTFLAVAGRGSFDATSAVAEVLMPSGNMLWGLDESLWDSFEVFGQPVTFAISHDGVIVDNWYGLRDDAEIRNVLDGLVSSNA